MTAFVHMTKTPGGLGCWLLIVLNLKGHLALLGHLHHHNHPVQLLSDPAALLCINCFVNRCGSE